MLVKLEFGVSEKQKVEHGVYITREPMDESPGDLIEARFDRKHEFWERHGVTEEQSNRLFACAELKTLGLYYGYAFDNCLDLYCTNYDVECSYGMISTEGVIYTMDEVHEIFNNYNSEAPLKTGRARPEAPGQMKNQYGVADSIDQVLRFHRKLMMNPTQDFIVTYHTISKKDNPGWRWHKNGTYIGKQKPQAEHIGDEPLIESVIQYNIILLKEKTNAN